jgi:hypothetical protein
LNKSFSCNLKFLQLIILQTIIIFGLGIIAGFVLENWRNNNAEELFRNSEIGLLDVRLQSDIYSQGKFNCESA